MGFCVIGFWWYVGVWWSWGGLGCLLVCDGGDLV